MYSDDEDYEYNSDDASNDGSDDVSDLEVRPAPFRKNYTVLTEADIRRRQADDLAEVSAVLSVSASTAAILLCHHRWSPAAVLEAWFSDDAAVRESTGLLLSNQEVSGDAKKQFSCGICFETYGIDDAAHAGCGHLFCGMCWWIYITTSIKDGLGCLRLRCPDPSCGAAVDRDMVNQLVSNTDKDKYAGYLLRSYIEDNLKTKWCPAPGCEMAIEFDDVGSSSGSYDVSCLCSHVFCWNCTEEAHRPVDCDTVTKWVIKNSTEAENVNWILAYTKPCPKCKRPIEKSVGCMHMTCRAPCHFQFCWVCQGSWSEHRGYTCNRFPQEASSAKSRREMARMSIMRYTHYYERWAANESSRLRALADLHNMEVVNLEKLKLKLSKPVTELEFITEAWVQIVECRRALKWSYAYGYFIPEEENGKRTFFEYLQGEAELGLERLHQCAEKDLQVFLVDDENEPKDDFYTFRQKLIRLTSVTRTYFENLVKALENGLSDVDSHCSKALEEAQKKRTRDLGLPYPNQTGGQKRQFQNGGW